MASGPVSESPSWLQRTIVGGPSVLLTMAIGVLAASLSCLFILVRFGFDPVIRVVWLVAFIGASIAFQVMRDDRHLTREERLARVVEYPSWGWPRLPRLLGSKRRLGFVALVGLALVVAVRVSHLWRDPNSLSEVASVLTGALAVGVLGVMLTPDSRDDGDV